VPSTNVQRLADAGVTDADQLGPDDVTVIDSLSTDEVTAIISIAEKLYSDRSAIRVHSLKNGGARLMVPL